LASLAYAQSFGGSLQTLLIVAGVYGALCFVMLLVCGGRLKAVVDRA
jgi:hypothetical protein